MCWNIKAYIRSALNEYPHISNSKGEFHLTGGRVVIPKPLSAPFRPSIIVVFQAMTLFVDFPIIYLKGARFSIQYLK